MKYIDLTKEDGGSGIVDDKFLPNGTIITVGASGADFTSVQDALDYLESKISNGNITIHINAGTYTTSEQLLTKKCNISRLIIEGEENYGSQINTSFVSSYGALHHEMDYTLELKDFYINFTGTSTNARAIDVYKASKLILNNVKCTNFPGVGITCNGNSNIYATLNSTIIITGSNRGLVSIGLFLLDYNVTLSLTDVTTAICTSAGGLFHYNSLIRNYTNVTNQTSQTVNTPTNTGLIMGTIQS